MTETAVLKSEVVLVSLGDLKVRPDQEYRLEDKASLVSLAHSIETEGLHHNLVADEDGFVCSGTRRLGALRLAKWTGTVPCKRVDKKTADMIVLSANHQVVAPDPMRDSALVHRLLSQNGWTMGDVADAMGCDVHRVALLRQLQNLGPEARAAMESETHYMRGWPIDWIQEFAQLSVDAQKEAITEGVFTHVRDRSGLDRILVDYFHILGQAPWALDDVTLIPEAGACTTCPKHSGNTPFLFEDVSEKDEKGMKRLTCMDATCWLKKANASLGRKIVKLREKNPDLVIVADSGAKASLPILGEHPTMADWQVTPCTKSEKGAVPSLVVKGDNFVVTGYVRKPTAPSSPGKMAKPAAKKVEMSPAEKDKERREKLLRQRQSYVASSIIVKLREWGDKKPPEHMTLLGLVAAYRVDQPLTDEGVGRFLHGNAKARKELYATAVNHKKFDEAVWGRLKADVILSISSSGRDSIEEEYEEALWLAGLLGLGTEREFMVLAEAACPTPKSLQPTAAKEPKKAKAKKPVAKKKKRARAEDAFQPDSDA